ncbi:MAG: hypothetical protein ACNS64_01240 [Candidatus Halalkalibacterium sp. M3_1C_030]
MDEGITIDIQSRQVIETEIKKVSRDGKIGDIIDRLVGKHKIPVTVTKYKGGLNSHTLKIIDIIIEEKGKIQADKTQETLNNIKT